MLDREPAFVAVRTYIHKWQTNAIANAYLWQVVQAALDAIEEQLALERGVTGDAYVILYLGEPIAVCATRARARRWVRIAMLAREGSTRSQFRIKHTKIEE